MKAHSVLVDATVRIVASIKGYDLCGPEKCHLEIPVVEGGQDNISLFLGSGEMVSVDPRIIQVCCDTEMRFHFVEVFRGRLKEDIELKRKVGGTRWSVEVDSLQYEIVMPQFAEA
jgi:hypothetical protein